MSLIVEHTIYPIKKGIGKPDTLEAWYAYFSTGEAQHFFKLMQTLPSAGK